MMTRGIADPLATAYCRLYIAHHAQKLPLYDTGYLITCVNDIKLIFTRISSTKETAHGYLADSKRILSDVFMGQFHIVFDYGNMQVGFAESAYCLKCQTSCFLFERIRLKFNYTRSWW